MNQPGRSVTGQVPPVRVTVVPEIPTVPVVNDGQFGFRTEVALALETIGWFLPRAKSAWWPRLLGLASREMSLWAHVPPDVLLQALVLALGMPDGEFGGVVPYANPEWHFTQTYASGGGFTADLANVFVPRDAVTVWQAVAVPVAPQPPESFQVG